jgi:hypothetical protein
VHLRPVFGAQPGPNRTDFRTSPHAHHWLKHCFYWVSPERRSVAGLDGFTRFFRCLRAPLCKIRPVRLASPLARKRACEPADTTACEHVKQHRPSALGARRGYDRHAAFGGGSPHSKIGPGLKIFDPRGRPVHPVSGKPGRPVYSMLLEGSRRQTEESAGIPCDEKRLEGRARLRGH